MFGEPSADLLAAQAQARRVLQSHVEDEASPPPSILFGIRAAPLAPPVRGPCLRPPSRASVGTETWRDAKRTVSQGAADMERRTRAAARVVAILRAHMSAS